MGTSSDQKTPIECRLTEKGAEYRGTMIHTKSLATCQRWDSHTPHLHNFQDHFLFPDRNITSAGNYCRNPGGVKDAPWCFTTSQRTRWEYCDIPLCGCKTNKSGRGYAGTVSTTISGRRCQRWDRQVPQVHTYHDPGAFPDPSIQHAHNYCRNPDPWETKGPWCFAEDSEVRWEYCYVPFCECKTSRQGSEYGGKISITVAGKVCQRWDAQFPHQHRYYDACQFPEDSVAEAANYCRAPEPNEPDGPWCYTTNPDTRWEYCNVPYCDNKTIQARSNIDPTHSEESVLSNIHQGRDMYPAMTMSPSQSSAKIPVNPSFLIGMLISCLVLLILIFLVALYAARKSHRNTRQTSQPPKEQDSFENPTYLEKAMEIQQSRLLGLPERPPNLLDERYVTPSAEEDQRRGRRQSCHENRYALPVEVEPKYVNEVLRLLPPNKLHRKNSEEILGTKYVFVTPDIELQEGYSCSQVKVGGRDSPIYMNISSTNVSSV